jgi:hypothetical protein
MRSPLAQTKDICRHETVIGFTNECKIMQVKTQQLYYVVENQVNNNMFRPIHLFQLGHHQVKP